MDESSGTNGLHDNPVEPGHDARGRRATTLLLVLIGVLMVVVVMVLVARGRDEATDDQLVAGACDLNKGPCRAELGADTSVEVTLSPRPIPLAQPLEATAVVRGFTPARAELRIRSTTMSMGLTRIRFEPRDGILFGTNQLPVCVSGTMTWLATLRLDGEDVAHFRFDTRTP